MVRVGADARLRRLLAIVPWVVAADGPTVAEVCERFGVAEDTLLADLDLIFLCGVHPFTPDSLMEVVLDGGRVWINYAEYFARPLRLKPEEGLALVAAGAALQAVPGADPEGPLATGLAKLAAVLGIDAEGALEVELGSVPPGLLETLRSAVQERRPVEIDYYTYGRDVRTRRLVDPYGVFAADSEWYLSAYCHLAEADRRFRVDRIRSAVVLDRHFDEPTGTPTLSVFEPRPEDPRVVLDLEAEARWVVEQYPVESVEELGGGRTRVTLVASEHAWLERLLLRLGSRARPVSGADGVAAAVARRILRRYS